MYILYALQNPLSLVGIFMAIGGFVLLVVALAKRDVARKEAVIASTWLEATAVVDIAEVEQGPRSRYRPRLRYRFQLGGRTYEGTRLQWDPFGKKHPEQVRQRLAHCPPGSWIKIRYNPQDPADNVAGFGPPTNHKLFFALAIGLIVIGAGIAIAAMIAQPPPRRRRFYT